MNLRIFTSLVLIVFTQVLFAQKNYSTTSAQVHFIAQDDSDIDALNKAKPATSKGVYLRKLAVSSTMGVGVRVDTQTLNA